MKTHYIWKSVKIGDKLVFETYCGIKNTKSTTTNIKNLVDCKRCRRFLHH